MKDLKSRLQMVCWEHLSHNRIIQQDMVAVSSLPENQNPTGSPDEWVDWFLYRLQLDPWMLGGFVVIGVFALGTLSLVVFALLYGCCCSSKEPKQKKRKPRKNSKNAVI
ncbi:hypothetical protein ATANTOWER_031096 [Ataeniobius toweri]|uniref:Uncharacterized protein n=1 Tax=Ataeniobius toweri TaxID=208326 RepID=A0ABU7C4X5_9TELE|nr:hypothetical protein [Ataeniobius toweri]